MGFLWKWDAEAEKGYDCIKIIIKKDSKWKSADAADFCMSWFVAHGMNIFIQVGGLFGSTRPPEENLEREKSTK